MRTQGNGGLPVTPAPGPSAKLARKVLLNPLCPSQGADTVRDMEASYEIREGQPAGWLKAHAFMLPGRGTPGLPG